MELGGVKLGLLDLSDSVGDIDLPEALALVLLPPAREKLSEDGGFPSLWDNLDLLVERGMLLVRCQMSVGIEHMIYGLNIMLGEQSCLAIFVEEGKREWKSEK